MRAHSSPSILVATLIGIIVLLMLNRLLAADHSRRNWEIFTEMQYSTAFEPQSPNPLFADGRTNQDVQPGVIVRGAERFRYGPETAEAERAGRELANPIHEGDKRIEAVGGRLFQIYCTVCHGASGGGGGSVTKRGMIPPPSLLAARAKQLPDGHLFHILTRGQGNMASYAAQLGAEERWLVIRYIRSLQGAK